MASVIFPPIKEPASTKTPTLGSFSTAKTASAKFSSPTTGMVSTLILSPLMLCLSASLIAPMAT